MSTQADYQRLVGSLDRLTERQTLDLHREVSRRASAIRTRDPEWQRRREAGMAAARAWVPVRRDGKTW